MRFKQVGKHYIMLGFVLFVSLYFGISAMVGVNFLTGQPLVAHKPMCSFGLIGIDGLLECFWQYIQPFFALFDISSGLGIFNLILLSFTLVIAYMFLETIRGSG